MINSIRPIVTSYLDASSLFAQDLLDSYKDTFLKYAPKEYHLCRELAELAGQRFISLSSPMKVGVVALGAFTAIGAFYAMNHNQQASTAFNLSLPLPPQISDITLQVSKTFTARNFTNATQETCQVDAISPSISPSNVSTRPLEMCEKVAHDAPITLWRPLELYQTQSNTETPSFPLIVYDNSQLTESAAKVYETVNQQLPSLIHTKATTHDEVVSIAPRFPNSEQSVSSTQPSPSPTSFDLQPIDHFPAHPQDDKSHFGSIFDGAHLLSNLALTAIAAALGLKVFFFLKNRGHHSEKITPTAEIPQPLPTPPSPSSPPSPPAEVPQPKPRPTPKKSAGNFVYPNNKQPRHSRHVEKKVEEPVVEVSQEKSDETVSSEETSPMSSPDSSPESPRKSRERPQNRPLPKRDEWELNQTVLRKPKKRIEVESVKNEFAPLPRWQDQIINLIKKEPKRLFEIKYKNGKFCDSDFSQSQFVIIMEYFRNSRSVQFLTPGLEGELQPKCSSGELNLQFFAEADESFIYIYGDDLLIWQSFKKPIQNGDPSEFFTRIPLSDYNLKANTLIENLDNIILENNRLLIGERVLAFSYMHERFQQVKINILEQRDLIETLTRIENTEEALEKEYKYKRAKYIVLELMPQPKKRYLFFSDNDLILYELASPGQSNYIRVHLPDYQLSTSEILKGDNWYKLKVDEEENRLIIDLRPKMRLTLHKPSEGFLLHSQMDTIQTIGAVRGETGTNAQFLQIFGGALEDILGRLSAVHHDEDDS